jgi:flagellar protein FlbD
MITLHRLGHKLEVFHLNPDLILAVEATPDTVITLMTGVKIVVAETPQRVAAEMKAYRIEVLAGALSRRSEHRVAALAAARSAGHLHAVEDAPHA